jgi:hypothetical protein
MRKQLIMFHTHLKTEEVMSKLYQQQQSMSQTEATSNNYYNEPNNNMNNNPLNFADDLIMDNNNYA